MSDISRKLTFKNLAKYASEMSTWSVQPEGWADSLYLVLKVLFSPLPKIGAFVYRLTSPFPFNKKNRPKGRSFVKQILEFDRQRQSSNISRIVVVQSAAVFSVNRNRNSERQVVVVSVSAINV